ncbi:MAG: hypothetical protein HXY24_14875 [Rubrivivax sp.]|nr:hypothetical protein [Rubrivivax sp.]
MSPRLRPIGLFLLLLLLFPALGIFINALEAGFSGLAWWQWGLLAALPGLAWLWLRHFSVLGCRDRCRLPDGDA